MPNQSAPCPGSPNTQPNHPSPRAGEGRIAFRSDTVAQSLYRCNRCDPGAGSGCHRVWQSAVLSAGGAVSAQPSRNSLGGWLPARFPLAMHFIMLARGIGPRSLPDLQFGHSRHVQLVSEASTADGPVPSCLRMRSLKQRKIVWDQVYSLD